MKLLEIGLPDDIDPTTIIGIIIVHTTDNKVQTLDLLHPTLTDEGQDVIANQLTLKGLELQVSTSVNN